MTETKSAIKIHAEKQSYGWHAFFTEDF